MQHAQYLSIVCHTVVPFFVIIAETRKKKLYEYTENIEGIRSTLSFLIYNYVLYIWTFLKIEKILCHLES